MNPIARLLFVLVLRVHFHALAAPGDLDAGFVPPADLPAYSAALQPDGRILVGGAERLFSDGTLDPAYHSPGDADGSTAVQFDGKFLVAANPFNDPAQRFIFRVKTDDTRDTAFVVPTFDLNNSSNIYCTALQDDGRILIGGDFVTANSYPTNFTQRGGLARLLPDGSLDTSFEGGGEARCIAMQTDGKIVVAIVGSVSNGFHHFVTRLTSGGSLDPTLNLELTGNAAEVRSLVIQPDGKILVAGSFSAVGGTGRNGIARINANGTLDAAFNPDAADSVESLALQADGKIIIGGAFGEVGGIARSRIARLNPDGSVDPTFNPNANGTVQATALQADGKVIVAGGFTTVGGIARNQIARLLNDPGVQSLFASNQTRVQWLRSGATPEVVQVLFELSIDGGATWTPLGFGTRIAGGWERTGLNLPGGGTVRARGRTVGGRYNGSSGLVESLAIVGGFPEIVVEQPAGSPIADGGSASFPAIPAGGASTLTFTHQKHRPRRPHRLRH